MDLELPGVDDSIFQSATLLHLTVFMLDFNSKPEKLQEAKELLKKLEKPIKEEYLGGGQGKTAKPVYI